MKKAQTLLGAEAPSTSPDLEDLEAGLSIDENALDDAVQHQPDFFYQVAKQLALAESRRDAAKQSVGDAEAHQDYVVRKAAANSEGRTTEKQIEAQVRMSPEVMKATQVYLKLKEEVNLLSALKEAYQARGYALNKLVELWLGGYFGDVNTNRTSSAIKDRQAENNKREMPRLRKGGKVS